MWVGAFMAIAALIAVAGAAYARSSRRQGKAAERTSPSDVAARLDAFWAWWRSASPRLAAAIDARKAASIVAEVGARVHAIDPRLAWETGPGLKGGRHHFALSSEGDIELRVLAERWLSRAPPADGTWEYYPARQAFPPGDGWSLGLQDPAGTKIDFAAVRVGIEVDANRELVHVRFHHPALATLDEEQRARATILTLDKLLGEDGVERWVGGIEPHGEPLSDGQPLRALAEAVEALTRTATGERFMILQGKTSDGRPMVATVNLALKRVDHLLMDEHLTVTFPLLEPTAQGVTTSGEAEVLNKLEDELMAALGHDAVYIGRETGQGRRVLHFHVAAAGPAEERTRRWAKQHGERRVSVSIEHDPRWEVLRRW